jgi:putative thioredoxin
MNDMAHASEVTSETFHGTVVKRSHAVPVLVDYWAQWCGPCQMQLPVLGKLLEEYAGKFELAKVNADQERELAGHFGIKSLPTMKLFYQGQLVDEKIGAVPESEVRAMLDKHIQSDSDKFMQAAINAYQQGHAEQALELLNHALANDPDNAELKVAIAQILYAQGDTESTVKLLDSLDEEGAKLDGAISLRAQMKLAEQLAELPSLDEIEARLEKDPGDLEALLFKSRHLTAQEDYENAMECLLEIMRRDRGYDDDAGRKGLLELFDMLGGEHPAVQQYRRKLFTLLH